MSKLIWAKTVRTFGVSGLLLLLLPLTVPPGTAGADPQREITVMTQNLYVGSHFEAIFAAGTLPELWQAVETDLAEILATDVPSRMKAVAREAAVVRPDIIALQEAAIIRVGPRSPAPADTVLLDYADLVVRELRTQGLHYYPVAVFDGLDSELPAGFPPSKDVRITDRDVILARSDPETANIKITNSANGKYAAQASIQTIIGPVETSAGWALVDLKLRGQQIRIIGTHLEPPLSALSVEIQQAQAAELILGPANTPLPVVILGDLNSDPEGSFTDSYLQLRDAGFVDSWAEAHPTQPGLTCCQEGDLLNSTSALFVRIDYVLTRGGFNTFSADILGEDTTDKTPTGLWPSDHAGVVARLTLPWPSR